MKYCGVLILLCICFQLKAQSVTNDTLVISKDFHSSFAGAQYFDRVFFDDIMKAQVTINDPLISAYLDTLVAFNESEPVRVLACLGNYIVLDSVFKIQLVAVECQRKRDHVPSYMVWGFVLNAQGAVTSAECFFSENENRLYNERRCSLLTPNGRMIRQSQWSVDSIAVEYRDWLRLFEDGTPQVYPRCNDALWNECSGAILATTRQKSQAIGQIVSDAGVVNKIRVDYLRRHRPCRELAAGSIEPQRSYMLTSIQGREGEKVVVVLQNNMSLMKRNAWSLCIYSGDIYHLDEWSLLHVYGFEDSVDLMSSKLRIRESSRGLIIQIRGKGVKKMKVKVKDGGSE